MIYLYVKTHNKTGLKYFGKTTAEDPISYTGSGKYWVQHLKKHGYDFTTEIIGVFEDAELCSTFALEYCKVHNIVQSPEWANLIEENGLDGAPAGNTVTQETRKKISESLIGKPSKKTRYVLKEDRNIRSKRMRDINAETVWITDGVTDKRIKQEEELPAGWVYGRCARNLGNNFLGARNIEGNNTRGKIIYNNGKCHRYFIPGTQPAGWVQGKMAGFQGGTGALKKGKKYAK